MRKTIQEYGPHPVDVHVGVKLRTARVVNGFSQEKLANAIGLTFQQIQKYERGANRISASMLYEISRTLDLPVSYFFEGLEGPEGSGAPMLGRESLKLLRSFNAITDREVRQAVSQLMKAMENSQE